MDVLAVLGCLMGVYVPAAGVEGWFYGFLLRWSPSSLGLLGSAVQFQPSDVGALVYNGVYGEPAMTKIPRAYNDGDTRIRRL